MMKRLSDQAAAWVWRRVVLASPYCWLWEDCAFAKGKGKRNILFPSLVITGKDFWNARQWEKRKADIRALRGCPKATLREAMPRVRFRWFRVTLILPGFDLV